MDQWQLPETYLFNGHAIKYGVLGDGPPVVCVHGTPWASYNLRHLISGIARRHTVYFYDLLGYGNSAKPDSYVSLAIQNTLLDELINHWGLEQPAILGHDFGGATLLRTHLLNRRSFSKIVLIDPVAVSPWGSPFFKHVNRHENAFAGVPAYIHEAIVRAYVNTAAHLLLDGSTMDNIVRPWTTTDGQAAFYRQIAQADSAYTDEVQPLYSTLSMPVLILWGEQDTWIPLEKGVELHQLINGSQFHVLANAGHLIIEEQPQQLLQKILPFLQA
ncbi:MAG: alpha/beta hydrolase [Pseudomonadota bacterium]